MANDTYANWNIRFPGEVQDNKKVKEGGNLIFFH